MNEHEMWWQAYVAALGGNCAWSSTEESWRTNASPNVSAWEYADRAVADFGERFPGVMNPAPPATGSEVKP